MRGWWSLALLAACAHEGQVPFECSDGVDDDRDGAVDCADPDCNGKDGCGATVSTDDDTQDTTDIGDGGGDGTPVIKVDPPTLSFLVQDGCTAEPAIIQLYNPGEAFFDLVAPTLVGGDSGLVSVTLPERRVRAKASVQALVSPEPRSTGRYTTTIHFETEDDKPGQLDLPVELVVSSGTVTDTFPITPAAKLDLLFVVGKSIDDQGFWDHPSGALHDNADGLFDRLVFRGTDFHVGITTDLLGAGTQDGRLLGNVVTPSTPNPTRTFQLQLQAHDDLSGRARLFDAARAAQLPSATSTSPNDGLARADARLVVVLVNEYDDGSDLSAGSFVSFIQGLRGAPGVGLGAIVAERSGLLPCGLLPWPLLPAPRIHTALDKVDGYWIDACTVDYTAELRSLVDFALGEVSTFELRATPTNPPPSGWTVQKDGATVGEGQPNGWTWDAGSNTVTLHGSSRPSLGDTVSVTYPGDAPCP